MSREPVVKALVDPRVPPGRAVVLVHDTDGNVISATNVDQQDVPHLVRDVHDPTAAGHGRNRPHRVPPEDQCTVPCYGARDVPRLRDAVVDSWRSGLLAQLLRSHQTPLNLPYRPGTNRMWSVEEYVKWAADKLADADLFYVTHDMSQVVRHGAAAAPFYQIEKDQQPAEAGFVVFGDTVCTITAETCDDGSVLPGERSEIIAAFWAWVDDCGLGEPGVLVVTLQDADIMLATRRHHGFPGEEAIAQLRGDWGPLLYHDEAPMPWGTRPFGQEPNRMRNTALAALQTMWIMMTQRITVEQTEKPNKQDKRRYAKTGRKAPEIRTVTLRRAAPSRQVRKPGESQRVYTHRWVIDPYSYWRNTWYPSKGEHRQQLVVVSEPFVKGPPGAPFIDAPKVKTLRR